MKASKIVLRFAKVKSFSAKAVVRKVKVEYEQKRLKEELKYSSVLSLIRIESSHLRPKCAELYLLRVIWGYRVESSHFSQSTGAESNCRKLGLGPVESDPMTRVVTTLPASIRDLARLRTRKYYLSTFQAS